MLCRAQRLRRFGVILASLRSCGLPLPTMSNAIVIRPLTPEDAADYRAIRLDALHRAPEAFGSTYAAEVGRSVEAFAERLATSTVLGAYDGTRVVGMAGFQRHTGAKHAHKGFVWGFYVAPEVRGRGVGVALLDGIAAAATGVVEQLTLSVVQTNAAALALYERCGFNVYGIEPRALKSAAGYADEVLMVRFLPV